MIKYRGAVSYVDNSVPVNLFFGEFLGSFLFLIEMFQTLDQLIKDHGDCAQNDNGCDDHIELEEIECVSEMDRHPAVLWR